jgi:NAD(P)-dependent dehydrogenase (short-subunit alcohol dehydrogenase family)
LAAEGAKVIIKGRSEKRVDEAIAMIRQKHPQARLAACAGDLSDAEVAQRVTTDFPQVDILVNNLGVYDTKPFEAISDHEWHEIIETNFMSGVRLRRHYLPEMKARNWGRIIFISSESAINIPVEMIHYGAETTAGTAVTVNSVLAGPTRSEGVEKFVDQIAHSRGIEQSHFEKEFFATVRPSSLLKRFASTDEVASLVIFLVSPLSSAINGTALRVDGGVVRSII